MPRYHNINGNNVQFTAAEETARDNEETACCKCCSSTCINKN